MNEQDRDTSGAAVPQESFGVAPGTGSGSAGPAPSKPGNPGPDEEFGNAPGNDGSSQNMGDAPKPAGNKNVPLLVGGGIAILIALAALFGLVLR